MTFYEASEIFAILFSITSAFFFLCAWLSAKSRDCWFQIWIGEFYFSIRDLQKKRVKYKWNPFLKFYSVKTYFEIPEKNSKLFYKRKLIFYVLKFIWNMWEFINTRIFACKTNLSEVKICHLSVFTCVIILFMKLTTTLF